MQQRQLAARSGNSRLHDAGSSSHSNGWPALRTFGVWTGRRPNWRSTTALSPKRADTGGFTGFHVGRMRLTLARERPILGIMPLYQWTASIDSCPSGHAQE
jgi:hypothetical protein